MICCLLSLINKIHQTSGAKPIDAEVAALEQALNSFDRAVRTEALARLVDLADRGNIACDPPGDVANMHCHTFFSYNAYGHSPASLAWLARRRGWAAAGIVDFDVLDGVDEFLAACDLAGVRGSAGIETRVFVPEYASREINSLGEPGVAYHMGIGFPSGEVPGEAAAIAAALRERAARRNREMVGRINAQLSPVTIDYDRDVLPLTPAGNATERHILLAYIRTAEKALGQGAIAFWGGRLGVPAAQIAAAIGNYARFSNLVRARLMKRGGAGYVQPGPESFPTLAEFHRLILACGALPCGAWLDGTTEGERSLDELLGLLVGQGIRALNLIPDRNWNVADPEARALKLGKLHEIVQVAGRLALALNVGTEMNSPGNRLVDDFDAPEMAPFRKPFLDGAYFICGHTAMQRGRLQGAGSAWALAHLPERRAAYDFYTALGRRVAPGAAGRERLRALDARSGPAELLAGLPQEPGQ